ncbi:unnamed protein product [Oppiella nova]|uniref:Uncharacterized protein n=1 Tax=Oppiella nova TaxID=334625 RepID=A0A7R9QPL2_9ACAR|nr:unnamed protein product [Oppiella nova]CAG2170956.1 unnamed protein product [Oppiella nova]
MLFYGHEKVLPHKWFDESKQMRPKSDHNVTYVLRPIMDYRNNFNELEGIKFTELLNASNELSTGFTRMGGTHEVWTVIDSGTEMLKIWASKVEEGIHQVVKLGQHLGSFNNFCEADKLLLLKHGSIHNHKNTIFSLDLLESKLSKPDRYELQRSFLCTFQFDWDSDVVIMNLMTAIIFFSPNHPNLCHRDVVDILNIKEDIKKDV